MDSRKIRQAKEVHREKNVRAKAQSRQHVLQKSDLITTGLSESITS